MQRLSNAALAVALTTFVSAVSLALLVAAWLMASHLLNGLSRSPLPKWLFVSLLILGFNRIATAQSNATGAFAVVDQRTVNTSGQPIISYTLVTTFDTLPPPVRTERPVAKKSISPNPNWPDDDFSVISRQDSPADAAVFYIIAIKPNSPAHEPGFWLKKYP